MNLSSVKITTDRLTIRPISPEDVTVIFREFTSEITLYMFSKPSKQIEETQAFIENSIETMRAGHNLQMVVEHSGTGDFLGCAGIHQLATETPELGIWLKKAAQGSGYGFETIQALVEWARKNLDFQYLKYPVDKRNIASKQIPIKLNAKDGRHYKKLNLSGFELDEIEYWISP